MATAPVEMRRWNISTRRIDSRYNRAMLPVEFVDKWSKLQQKETALYASHFDDVCRLVGHETPAEYGAKYGDPTGAVFSFQTLTVKPGGQKGFADVFFRGRFIWEYKGPHADLDKAYRQLQLYREALENPPLLITSDMRDIRIHTNFTNRPTVETIVTFDDILAGTGVETLRRVFVDPDSFKPEKTRENITRATADTFLAVAEALRQHQRLTEEAYSPEQRAHFLIRLLFCLFAEDLGLLPDGLFTQLVKSQGKAYTDLRQPLRNLFAAMRDGGHFGMFAIRHFNGSLFDDAFVPALPYDLAQKVLRAAEQDWSAVDPSIFGTLFERIIDEGKRAQLGAHYTGIDDILLIVEPVLMEPLRRKWDEIRRVTGDELRATSGDAAARAHERLAGFARELSQVRVLDPACGSGNFLYVALRRLLDLQKEVISYAARQGLPEIPLSVGPQQLYGIEVNEYAHELAQVTVWIGYLQWRYENGFGEMADPVLRPLRNIRRMDAILTYDADGKPVEPDWPAAEVIIGNPPFLGGKKTLTELGQTYMDDLRDVYKGRLPGFSDLVVYWFEKARTQIEMGKAMRTGLIATNSIAMGTNLPVLKRIKESGDIFFAWDDRPWVLDGAAVRVAIIGFDSGDEVNRRLNDEAVRSINADLTSGLDLTRAIVLEENKNLSFIGTQKSGPFDIDTTTARIMLAAQNKNGLPNSDVIVPWVNGSDLVQHNRNMYIIDFPGDMSETDARKYELPFAYVEKHVKPTRTAKHFEGFPFWIHWNTRPAMREALSGCTRYICIPRVSKHRIFTWLKSRTNPDSATVAIARDDDYFFGVLHARPHELWALRMGTSLEDRPRYTPTTTFETYPFPWPPGQEPPGDDRVAEIARYARALNEWREAWLNPPPPAKGTIDVAYNRLIKVRTLTNLYNGLVYYRTARPFDRAAFDKETRKSVSRAEIQELDDIHHNLDRAVFRAYGWPDDLTDEEILERLLALNFARAEP
ncbi:MAG: class I SAM-dependent DNA methyltransferase [Anaerolineae bacterium]|nr:class I SAM-dependent DNA methyltransferase [Anaerolineae bacterium]